MTLGFPTIVIPAIMAQTLADPSGNLTLNGSQSSHDSHGSHDSLYLTKEQISWFSSINLICVPVGSLLSGVLTQPFGRKPSMITLNIPFIAAWLVYHYADSVVMLYAALALTGFSGGVLEAPVLTYVAEITQPHLRGMLSATASMCVILGVFLQFVLGIFMNWRTVALINIVFPILAICALCCVPESPHWLIGKGRIQEAEKSLQWLRGWVQPGDVQAELSMLVKSIQSSAELHQQSRSWQPFLRRTFLRPYGIVALAFFAGHLGGMTTLQTFAVSIFAELGTPVDKFIATMLLGLVQLLGALVCVVSVHWTGKRPLTFVSLVGSSICFGLTAVYAHYHKLNPVSVDYSWMPLVLLVAAAFLTHTCIRLLPWILIGEVYPPEVRGTASGASGSIGYIFGFLANKTYFLKLDILSLAGTFLVYSAVSMAGAVALYLVLPETEGRTLQEIQEHFAGTRNLLTEGRRSRREQGEPTKWAADNPAMDHQESHL
ncbi:facilitated trehalose transporter Tret1-like isoform X2 [Homalodisca vitripennis]|nr:facilitated trehalose transporter Tret1-like isoform X2 [Homalodisca vitripennis]